MANGGGDDYNDRVLTFFKIILLIFYRLKTRESAACRSSIFIVQCKKKFQQNQCIYNILCYNIIYLSHLYNLKL